MSQIEITQKDVHEILENIKGSMLESVKKELSERSVYMLQDKILNTISKEVSGWVEKNLIPDMILLLNQQKEELLKGSLNIANQASAEIQKALSEMVRNAFASSYKREDIIKKVLGF